jgi:excisionase family DNA binding protein
LHGFLVANAAAATPRLLTPMEVAKWLGVSPGWVRDHATRKRPHLRAVKLGKLLRFRQKDVEENAGEAGQGRKRRGRPPQWMQEA